MSRYFWSYAFPSIPRPGDASSYFTYNVLPMTICFREAISVTSPNFVTSSNVKWQQ